MSAFCRGKHLSVSLYDLNPDKMCSLVFLQQKRIASALSSAEMAGLSTSGKMQYGFSQWEKKKTRVLFSFQSFEWLCGKNTAYKYKCTQMSTKWRFIYSISALKYYIWVTYSWAFPFDTDLWFTSHWPVRHSRVSAHCPGWLQYSSRLSNNTKIENNETIINLFQS